MAKPVKAQFKTPEGRYILHSEKTAGIVQWRAKRTSRLTVAPLSLPDDQQGGCYIVYNLGDYLNICRFDSSHKEPLKSFIFNPQAVREGYPCVHAYQPARDHVDLLVGIANGEVHLLSLRAQLATPPGTTKPVVAATLNAENVHNSSRVTAVAWVPRCQVAQFLAAHADGAILVYKKTASMVGESSSAKLLSQLSSKSSGLNPINTINPGGGGINDVSFSPDGARLAVACRDGSCRVLDWPSGHCTAGFQSYYGAVLCCSWSPDGNYIAAGGEDDLVTMYSVLDRQQVAFGEGHNSWVSRVAFDPYQGSEHTGTDGVITKTYRIGSVGQDTQLCLWDLVIEDDPYYYNQQKGQTGMKRVASQTHVANAPSSSSSLSTSVLHEHSSHHSHSHSHSHSQSGLDMPRSSSGNLLGMLKQSNGGANPITVSVPRGEMVLIPPVMTSKVHQEPLSDLLFTDEGLFTVCCVGQIRTWLRPSAQLEDELEEQEQRPLPAEEEAQPQQQQQLAHQQQLERMSSQE